VLHSFHTSVTQEIQLCAELTAMELVKATANNDAIHVEYSKIMMEWDEAMSKTERLKQEVQEIYNNIPKVYMEVDASLEEKVMNISEAIQGFCAKIVDLEYRTTLSTPPEKREQREQTTIMTMESINTLDEECTKLYEEST
jgi:hypothetical protein